MTLTKRKPRPLSRSQQAFRDDRLFIVACDDTYAPHQYFGFFQLSRVQVHVVATTDGTSVAKHVLDRLLNFEHEDDDQLWLLVDTDHCTTGTHLKCFLDALKDARQNRVNVAISKPCFELWLLLHHVEADQVQALPHAAAATNSLKVTLGGYNKTSLKKEQFPLEAVVRACHRAEMLDNAVIGGDNPVANTTRVYQLWKAIAAQALPSQLPEELRALIVTQPIAAQS